MPFLRPLRQPAQEGYRHEGQVDGQEEPVVRVLGEAFEAGEDAAQGARVGHDVGEDGRSVVLVSGLRSAQHGRPARGGLPQAREGVAQEGRVAPGQQGLVLAHALALAAREHVSDHVRRARAPRPRNRHFLAQAVALLLKDQVISNSARDRAVGGAAHRAGHEGRGLAVRDRPQDRRPSSPARSAKTNRDSPTIFFVNTARRPVTSIETEAGCPSTSRLAGAPVLISAAMAWAAK